MTDSPNGEPTRLGILGGSFDPPHLGHLICARAAAEKLNLSKVLLVPTNIQPHKVKAAWSPAEIRLAMTRAIAALDPLFEVSDCEVVRGEISYTVETLEQLSAAYPFPAHRLFWLMGWDAALDFPTWRQPERIAELAELVALRRAGVGSNSLPQPWSDRIIVLETPVIEISSTEIRGRCQSGQSVALMVGLEVERIIRANSLYR